MFEKTIKYETVGQQMLHEKIELNNIVSYLFKVANYATVRPSNRKMTISCDTESLGRQDVGQFISIIKR
jgi:hypothetical protein